jgi:hypothetical protein
MFKHSLKALVVAATLVTAGLAQAGTVNYTVDSGWNRFQAGAVGTTVNRQFSFTLTQNAILSIVDGFLAGDQYEVFANGSSLGTTSVPGTGPNTGMNFDAALADGIHSMGSFILGPGSYLISLAVLSRSGTDTGGHIGALRVDVAPVPVPAAGALLLSALGAVALRRRRHHTA